MVLSATGSLGTSWDLANSLAIDPESTWGLEEEVTAPETHTPRHSDDARDELRHALHLQDGVALKKVRAEIPVTEKPDANDPPVQVAELSGFEMGGLALASASVPTITMAAMVFLASLSQLKEDASLYTQRAYWRFLAEQVLANLSRQQQPEVWKLLTFFQSHPLALNALLEVACDRKCTLLWI